MQTQKEFVAKFRKEVEEQLRQHIGEVGGECYVEVDGEEHGFSWRDGGVDKLFELVPKREAETALRVHVRLGVRVVVEDVSVETF